MGFRAWGLGFRVWGLGFRAWGLEFRDGWIWKVEQAIYVGASLVRVGLCGFMIQDLY